MRESIMWATAKDAQAFIDDMGQSDSAEPDKSEARKDGNSIDHGAHYRYEYKGIKIDPYRVCQIYNVTDFALQTIIKKALVAGGRGYKNKRQDLLDIRNATDRALEMMDEDER